MTVGNILVVEDNDDLRDLLSSVLEDEGYNVRTAANGREALKCLRDGAQRPDAIVLDLMMPVMSGAEFREEQSRDPDLSPIPVILVSASAHARAVALELSVEAFLRKPLSADALIRTVGRLCSGKRCGNAS